MFKQKKNPTSSLVHVTKIIWIMHNYYCMSQVKKKKKKEIGNDSKQTGPSKEDK